MSPSDVQAGADRVLAYVKARGRNAATTVSAFDKTDPKTLSSDVTIASDALIVLMTYQNNGYALMSF